MHPSDIRHLLSVSTPALAPDASFAIVAVSHPDEGADRSVGQLWRFELDGAGRRHGAPRRESGAARRLTRGISDSAPRLSPDGSVLAFLRPDARGRAQIHLLDPRGGEPMKVTDAPLGVGEFVFSPDGSRLAFLARIPEPGRYGTVDGIGPDAEPARRVDSVRWHANGVGWSIDRSRQVHVLDLPSLDDEPEYPQAPRVGTGSEGGADGVRGPAESDGAEGADGAEDASPAPGTVVQLTEGPDDHTALAFDTDGTRVLAVRDRLESDVRDLRSVLVAIDAGTPSSASILLEEADGLSIDQLVALPGGALALLASEPIDGRDAIAPDRAVWLLDPPSGSASGRPRRITDPEQLELTSAGPLETAGDRVLVHELTRGRIHLHLVSRDGTTQEVLGGDLEAHGAAAVSPLGRAGEVVVLAAVSTPTSAGELVQVQVPAPGESDADAARALPSAPRVLTDLGADLRACGLVAPRELEVAGRDGHPVHGWLAVPEGEGPFPVILIIHGGPFAHYGVSVFDEVQVLAGAGYAVAYCNPRGSAGYGRAHGRAIRHRMGTDDFADVIDFLEGAIAADAAEHPGRLDASRPGIMGGSYGGYLTAWTIAHDHRFAAAIVERGFLDPASFQGTSDIGSYFGDEYVGTDPADIARQSPFAHVGDVRTPTFVIHSEQDLRCPLEQGTRYFAALRRNGVPSSMLVFPGEDHELTRSGRPRHRLQRFAAIQDWWEQAFSGRA
ncbi:S9 family peptidase [Brachybacterium sp. MASK1Z-5]|uniref:S9 family peptidase n=1 Tax=Brachybacterium halotolerans TaxID=2795215 RepID=A0ABS1B867_9MICO|nr:S9 family peptidase [Brachybacterium halotolerans]